MSGRDHTTGKSHEEEPMFRVVTKLVGLLRWTGLFGPLTSFVFLKFYLLRLLASAIVLAGFAVYQGLQGFGVL